MGQNAPSQSKSPGVPSLEWKFVDFRKADASPIFEVDPGMLKKFIGQTVTVVTTSREEFHGCCLAIDPVSLSVILAKKVLGHKIRTVTLPGYHLARIYVDPESVLPEECVSVNDLDVAELYHAPSLYSEKAISKSSSYSDNSKLVCSTDLKDDVSTNCVLSENQENCDVVKPGVPDVEIHKRKDILIGLLKKQHLPVNVKGDIIEGPGGVKINPPYTVESCDTRGNQIIKKKLGELMKAMPDLNFT